MAETNNVLHNHYRRYRALYKRAVYSLSIIIIVLAFGTISLHYLDDLSYVDSFYFMSMLATGQGPSTMPATVAGKLFVSIMAFVSVGTVVFALGFLFGPVFARLIRVSEIELKKEERSILSRVKKYEKKI